MKFREWVELTLTMNKFMTLMNQRQIADAMALLDTVLPEYSGWENGLNQFITLQQKLSLKHEFAFLQPSDKPVIQKEVWDYDGRDFYAWSHILANAYGWTLDTIGEMDVDDALAMIQEAMVESYHKRDWEWRRTEIAYSYDKVTKSSRYVDLPKPDWMKQKKLDKVVKVTAMMPKSMIPVGLVHTGSEDAVE
jgi:hypothetical protein